MRDKSLLLFILLCAISAASTQAHSQGLKSLSDYLLSPNLEDLPSDFELDEQERWVEIWHKEKGKMGGAPQAVMEQGIGVKWIGLAPDKKGTPQKWSLVFADKFIVEMKNGVTRFGKVDSAADKILWADGSKQVESYFQNKKRRKGRRGRGKAINLGKIVLPQVNVKIKELPLKTADELEGFINKLAKSVDSPWSTQDKLLLHHFNDKRKSFMKLRFHSNCSEEDKLVLQNHFIEYVEPKLTCWADQNPEQALQLIAAFYQEPMVYCKTRSQQICGEASVPREGGLFVTQPELRFNLAHCAEDMPSTELHEFLHIAGLNDGPEIEAAEQQAHSCQTYAPQLAFEGEAEEYMNDLQVETRLLLFRKVREDAVEKWGWAEGEKNYVLGEICNKMGDKFCSRRFFQLALEEPSSVQLTLPEGSEVTFKSAAHFGLYSSISEDFPRMHELARYLTHDPNGALLKRLETDTHRLHDFFIAYAALEKAKANRGICNSQNDDKVSCDDLVTISRSAWFRGF